jgi:hypothetical protein
VLNHNKSCCPFGQQLFCAFAPAERGATFPEKGRSRLCWRSTAKALATGFPGTSVALVKVGQELVSYDFAAFDLKVFLLLAPHRTK